MRLTAAIVAPLVHSFRAPTRISLLLAGAILGLHGCGEGAGGTTSSSGASGAGGGLSTWTTSATGGGEVPAGPCVSATGPGAAGTADLTDGPDKATVTVESRDGCERTYHLSTSAALRDDALENPRTITEGGGQPVLRTHHDVFDALYALALDEAREDSVDSIKDGAFNGGMPMACPPGGCFETGRLWTYVWTRDTSYAVALGLGALDPTRARNSLEFKTSERRGGGGRQIVQDTGSGGSYPISSDRVIWAMGAWELLKFLDGQERSAFLDLACEAIWNTAEHDRKVVYDAEDGLYSGEQSFLDWREQSYPAWTAEDPVQIGMSKALSTNVAHFTLLDVAAKLAAEKGDSAASGRYAGWAASLKTAIDARFWMDQRGLYSTFVTTFLDPAPAERFDLLGSALAVLTGVAGEERARTVLGSYPHLPQGAAVIWPQQKDMPIYHNRAIWPFVTAFWLRAAKKADNSAAVEHAVRSLVRGAALNLSNMENFEATTGKTWLEEGATSGPVVNSERQLWSVAGYLSMVHDVIFGMEASQSGIRFRPYLTRGLRDTLFAGAESLALSNLTYKGRRISVVVKLPSASGISGDGALPIASIALNGAPIGDDFLSPEHLLDHNVIEIRLGSAAGPARSITALTDAQLADPRNLFAPREPSITGVVVAQDRVTLTLDAGDEDKGQIAFRVYRDGQLVGSSIQGSTTSWQDSSSSAHATTSYCYAVESYDTASKNTSQRSRPSCYWGPGYDRILTVGAQSFQSSGGALSADHGMWHYDGWGAPGDTLTLTGFKPSHTGRHLIQLTAGNGSGPFNTGITCGVKLVEVKEGGVVVASGQVAMPQLGTWDDWKGSSFLRAHLDKNKVYTITIREDGASSNMSVFQHFNRYGGTGGEAGPFNHVNISELKVLALQTGG